MWRFAILVSCAMLPIVSCKARHTPANLRGLNAAEGLAESRFNDPEERKKTPVLIYYLNNSIYWNRNSGISRNRQHLASALESCARMNLSPADLQLVEQLHQRILDDEREFAAAGDWEYGIMHSLMDENPRLRTFTFRNTMATNPGFEHFLLQGSIVSWKGFPALNATDPEVYRYQPLMRPQVMAAALTAVKEIAPPDKHRYIIIAKSHGNATMAMTAFLAKDITNLSHEDICKAIVKHQKTVALAGTTSPVKDLLDRENAPLKDTRSPLGKETIDPLGKETIDPLGKETIDPLGKDGAGLLGDISAIDYLGFLSSGKQGLDSPEAGKTMPGVSKFEFAEFLFKQRDMYFPIVVMESCKSTHSFTDQLKSIGAHKAFSNISYVYTSNSGGLQYRNFDYQQLFRRTNAGEDLQDVVKSIVDATIK